MDSVLEQQIENYNQDTLERDAKLKKIFNSNNTAYVGDSDRVEHFVRLSDDDEEDENVLDEESEELLSIYDTYDPDDYDEDATEMVEPAIDPIVEILNVSDNIPMFPDELKDKGKTMYPNNGQNNNVLIIDAATNQPVLLPNGQTMYLPANQAPTCPVSVVADNNGNLRVNSYGMPLLAYQLPNQTWAEWLPGIEHGTGCLSNSAQQPQQQPPQYGSYQNPQQQNNGYANNSHKGINPGGYVGAPVHEPIDPNVADRYAGTVGAQVPQPVIDTPAYAAQSASATQNVDSNLFINYFDENIAVVPVEKLPNRAKVTYGDIGDYKFDYTVVAGYVKGVITEFLVGAEEMERTLEYGGELYAVHSDGTRREVTKAEIIVKETPRLIPKLVVSDVDIYSTSLSDARWAANEYYFKGEERNPLATLKTRISYNITMDDLSPIATELAEITVNDITSYIEFYETLLSAKGYTAVRTAKFIDKMMTGRINDIIRFAMPVVNDGLEISSIGADWKDLDAYFLGKGGDVYAAYNKEMKILFTIGLEIIFGENDSLHFDLLAPTVHYEDDLNVPTGRLLPNGKEDLYFLIRAARDLHKTNTLLLHTNDNNMYQVTMNTSNYTPAIFITKKL